MLRIVLEVRIPDCSTAHSRATFRMHLCGAGEQARQHVWTLAAGTAYTLPETLATQLREGDPTLLELARTCTYSTPGVLPGRHCFLGNCDCHSTSAFRNATISPILDDAFRVPDFVGNKYFCDAGAGPPDDISAVGNSVGSELQPCQRTHTPHCMNEVDLFSPRE